MWTLSPCKRYWTEHYDEWSDYNIIFRPYFLIIFHFGFDYRDRSQMQISSQKKSSRCHRRNVNVQKIHIIISTGYPFDKNGFFNTNFGRVCAWLNLISDTNQFYKERYNFMNVEYWLFMFIITRIMTVDITKQRVYLKVITNFRSHVHTAIILWQPNIYWIECLINNYCRRKRKIKHSTCGKRGLKKRTLYSEVDSTISSRKIVTSCKDWTWKNECFQKFCITNLFKKNVYQ